MGLFERFLTVWVALGIVAGVSLGLALPAAFSAVAAIEFAHVNLVVAVLIWLMIYPMMMIGLISQNHPSMQLRPPSPVLFAGLLGNGKFGVANLGILRQNT